MVKGWTAGVPSSREEYKDPSGRVVRCEPGDQWLTARRHYLRVMTLKDAKTLKEEHNRHRLPREHKTNQTILGCMFAEIGDTEQYPMGMTPEQYKSLVFCTICKRKKCDTRTHIYRKSRANAVELYGDNHGKRVVCDSCKKEALAARDSSVASSLGYNGLARKRDPPHVLSVGSVVQPEDAVDGSLAPHLDGNLSRPAPPPEVELPVHADHMRSLTAQQRARQDVSSEEDHWLFAGGSSSSLGDLSADTGQLVDLPASRASVGKTDGDSARSFLISRHELEPNSPGDGQEWLAEESSTSALGASVNVAVPDGGDGPVPSRGIACSGVAFDSDAGGNGEEGSSEEDHWLFAGGSSSSLGDLSADTGQLVDLPVSRASVGKTDGDSARSFLISRHELEPNSPGDGQEWLAEESSTNALGASVNVAVPDGGDGPVPSRGIACSGVAFDSDAGGSGEEGSSEEDHWLFAGGSSSSLGDLSADTGQLVDLPVSRASVGKTDGDSARSFLISRHELEPNSPGDGQEWLAEESSTSALGASVNVAVPDGGDGPVPSRGIACSGVAFDSDAGGSGEEGPSEEDHWLFAGGSSSSLGDLSADTGQLVDLPVSRASVGKTDGDSARSFLISRHELEPNSPGDGQEWLAEESSTSALGASVNVAVPDGGDGPVPSRGIAWPAAWWSNSYSTGPSSFEMQTMSPAQGSLLEDSLLSPEPSDGGNRCEMTTSITTTTTSSTNSTDTGQSSKRRKLHPAIVASMSAVLSVVMTVALLYPQHLARVQREYNVAARISGHNFRQSTVRLEVQASLAELSTQSSRRRLGEQRCRAACVSKVEPTSWYETLENEVGRRKVVNSWGWGSCTEASLCTTNDIDGFAELAVQHVEVVNYTVHIPTDRNVTEMTIQGREDMYGRLLDFGGWRTVDGGWGLASRNLALCKSRRNISTTFTFSMPTAISKRKIHEAVSIGLEHVQNTGRCAHVLSVVTSTGDAVPLLDQWYEAMTSKKFFSTLELQQTVAWQARNRPDADVAYLQYHPGANRRCRWDELINCDVHAVCVATGSDTYTCACAETLGFFGPRSPSNICAKQLLGLCGTTKDSLSSCRDDPEFRDADGLPCAAHKGSTVCDEQQQRSPTSGSVTSVTAVAAACPFSCGTCKYFDAVEVEASQFTQASHSGDRYAYISCPAGCETTGYTHKNRLVNGAFALGRGSHVCEAAGPGYHKLHLPAHPCPDCRTVNAYDDSGVTNNTCQQLLASGTLTCNDFAVGGRYVGYCNLECGFNWYDANPETHKACTAILAGLVPGIDPVDTCTCNSSMLAECAGMSQLSWPECKQYLCGALYAPNGTGVVLSKGDAPSHLVGYCDFECNMCSSSSAECAASAPDGYFVEPATATPAQNCTPFAVPLLPRAGYRDILCTGHEVGDLCTLQCREPYVEQFSFLQSPRCGNGRGDFIPGPSGCDDPYFATWKCVQGPFGTADWEYQGHTNTNDTTRWHPLCNISAMILACKPLTDALTAASMYDRTGTTFSFSAMRKTCYASLYSMRRTCIPDRHVEVLQPVWNWTRLDERFKVPYTESDLITTRHDARLHPTIGMHWSAAIAWGDNQLRVCGRFNAGQQLLLKDCAHNTISVCRRWSRCARFLDPNHDSMARNRPVRPCCQLISDDVCEPCLSTNGSRGAMLWRKVQLFAKLDDGSVVVKLRGNNGSYVELAGVCESDLVANPAYVQ